MLCGKRLKIKVWREKFDEEDKGENIIRGMIRLKNASYKTQEQQNCAPSVLVREKKRLWVCWNLSKWSMNTPSFTSYNNIILFWCLESAVLCKPIHVQQLAVLRSCQLIWSGSAVLVVNFWFPFFYFRYIFRRWISITRCTHTNFYNITISFYTLITENPGKQFLFYKLQYHL